MTTEFKLPELGEILGSHIIGHGATEMIGELTVAKALESTPLEIAQTSHAHPTLSEAIMEAALGVMGIMTINNT